MLNQALKLIRIFHDLTQKELAERLEISKSYLSEIESGKKTPSLEIISGYSEQFNIPMSSILFFSESIDDTSRTEQLRKVVSGKVLAMLDFIAAKS
jgi:transcriptional regulator with XRE-family HTH domain